MCLHYGYDKESWSLVEQYLVGTELLAAPVLYEGATSSEVYFPFFSGSWVHIVSQPVFFYSIFFKVVLFGTFLFCNCATVLFVWCV
jgi:hypothetical protein